MSRVSIIGAGLAGSLLAIYLAKRGIEVDVFESRGDTRLGEVAGGRSINLALSNRGIAALREVGMDQYMLAEAVPMYGRMIHSPTGDTKLLPYSGRNGEYINSISRGGLNSALINEAEKHAGVTFHFHKKCVDLDCESGAVKFADGSMAVADTVIATDGAGSAVRQAMEKQAEGFTASSEFLEHGYKELHIPPADWNAGVPPATNASRSESRNVQLAEANALHIWPRHQFMMIALPNFDGSFTCTLFLANKSEPLALVGGPNVDFKSNVVPPAHAGGSDKTALDRLTDAASIREFFEREFPDAVSLMPTLVEDFFANPTGELGTVKCWPWNVDGKVLLLGDAAHAMVPFYGQGMNCAFEDVRVLASLIDEHGTDWQAVFEQYCDLRKPNTDAIQTMAEENFYEMRDATADPVFQRKRALETRLEQTYPAYFSKYSMVTFREDVPYAVAKDKGNAQDRLLMELCRNIADVASVDLSEVRQKLLDLGAMK